MLIRKPYYFDDFRCIAGACPDSCCKEWEVQVDAQAAEYYRSLSGPLGDRLREVLREEDGENLMTIIDGRCPMWRQDGLCRIQAELGEEALCKTCREFPRLTHDFGDFVEYGLELSCPEAARFILEAHPEPLLEAGEPEEDLAEYDGEAMEILLSTRKKALDLLSHPEAPVGETLVQLLLYGCQAQSDLDSGEELEFDPDAAMETARELAKPAEIKPVLDFFGELEMLTRQWEERLRDPQPSRWEQGHLALARYLVQRYWLQAVSDYDLYSRVKMIVISCLLVKNLGGNLLETVQLFSKEIENDADNVDALLDAAYAHPAFTDDKLLFLLMQE